MEKQYFLERVKGVFEDEKMANAVARHLEQGGVSYFGALSRAQRDSSGGDSRSLDDQMFSSTLRDDDLEFHQSISLELA